MLIERSEKNNIELYKKAARFNELFKNLINKPLSNEIENQFVLVPPGEASLARLTELANISQSRILTITTLQKLLPWINEPFIIKALERGVVIKAITDKNSGPSIPKEIINLQKKYFFEVKFMNLSSSLCFGVFDNKEAILTISPDTAYCKSSILWTNCAGFIELTQNYFYYAWAKN